LRKSPMERITLRLGAQGETRRQLVRR